MLRHIVFLRSLSFFSGVPLETEHKPECMLNCTLKPEMLPRSYREICYKKFILMAFSICSISLWLTQHSTQHNTLSLSLSIPLFMNDPKSSFILSHTRLVIKSPTIA
jgi:hypothetical protein